MDIIVHGWHMPDSCAECVFCRSRDNPFRWLLCYVTKEPLTTDKNNNLREDFDFAKERSKQCPLEIYNNR